jgi:hypothetical protein
MHPVDPVDDLVQDSLHRVGLRRVPGTLLGPT